VIDSIHLITTKHESLENTIIAFDWYVSPVYLYKAEYQALSVGVSEAIWLRNLLQE